MKKRFTKKQSHLINARDSDKEEEIQRIVRELLDQTKALSYNGDKNQVHYLEQIVSRIVERIEDSADFERNLEAEEKNEEDEYTSCGVCGDEVPVMRQLWDSDLGDYRHLGCNPEKREKNMKTGEGENR